MVGESAQMAATPAGKNFAAKVKEMRDAVLKRITDVDKIFGDIEKLSKPVVKTSMDAKTKGRAASALEGSKKVAQMSTTEPEEVNPPFFFTHVTFSVIIPTKILRGCHVRAR